MPTILLRPIRFYIGYPTGNDNTMRFLKGIDFVIWLILTLINISASDAFALFSVGTLRTLLVIGAIAALFLLLGRHREVNKRLKISIDIILLVLFVIRLV